MPDEAAAAEHNGYIWSRPPTKYGANPTEKIQAFLLKNSINAEKDARPNKNGRRSDPSDRRRVRVKNGGGPLQSGRMIISCVVFCSPAVGP